MLFWWPMQWYVWCWWLSASSIQRAAKHWNENQRCLLQQKGNTDKHWWISSECFFLVHTYFKSSVAYDKYCCAKCQRTLVVCNSQVDRSFYGEIKRRCWLRKSSEMATGTPEFIPLDNLLSSGMLATQETQSVGRTSLKHPALFDLRDNLRH